MSSLYLYLCLHVTHSATQHVILRVEWKDQRLPFQELQWIGSILYYICSVHRINPRLESTFGTYHNLIKYIWIIQSNPIQSHLIQNNLHAEGLELESICT